MTMRNDILKQALDVSLESDVDSVIEELASEQREMGQVPYEQTVEEINQVEGDLDILDQIQASVQGTDVSVEQLAHARGMLDAIGLRYGADAVSVSTESVGSDRLSMEAIVAEVETYRDGLNKHVTASMEGAWLRADSLKQIGENLSVMKKTISVLKSNDVEKIKEVKLSGLRMFLKVGGGVPQDLPRAIKEVGRGLELTFKHSDEVLAAASKAGSIAMATDWTDQAAATKAREQIRGIKLNLDGISKDINGFPMFGNRSFGIKIKGDSGDLGEWNKKYSFGEGIPNAGFLYTAISMVGLIGMLTVSMLGGALVIVFAAAAASNGGKRELPVKELASALEVYSKSAEKIYGQRANAVKKSTVHDKLMSDLKNVNGLPKDVRKAIARASSFGWSMTNGVYDVVAHSVYALASASVRAAFH